MTSDILALNSGSSSLKFALFEARFDGDLSRVCNGEVDGIGTQPCFRAFDTAGQVLVDRSWSDATNLGHEAFFAELFSWIDSHRGEGRLVAAGHRVVHGGAKFSAPVRIDDAMLRKLDELVPLAPLHQPHNLAAIRALGRVRPDLPQVACFDTAFHHGLPAVATRFALPREFEARGVRRYGFHGLSYEYIAGELARIAPAVARGRVVVAHLGSGASLCAMRDGRSVDTTMGFTALDGLPMGTRCGALDPGVVLYLQQAQRMAPDAIEDVLYHRSGLLGVSGLSSDMRTLLESPEPRAEEAVELFVFRVAREIGALAASLGGIDALVFTAGIGEHAAEIRRRVCERAQWLGIEFDDTANEAGGPCLTRASSPMSAWVISTDEDLMIARHTRALIGTP
ncbi:acetate/propionate family kinase (plasmid) [Burkholderia thailandensis]|uniref:acetate/propionate family kinase n=1 Tax=Burkholderia thailandensis TaxID=57975 RepID=UPI00192DC5E0|nr:acetate/propionate family kinase [Burkholderia thailandensis]MBS2132173.1 acetate/propionate family kinase [Burkholderia thailandensis]QRA15274.1 acetate/propionate family kinase [Burkholderia thailandensis]